MPDSETVIIHRRLFLVHTQDPEEVVDGARSLFAALAPCRMFGHHDDRPGIEMQLARRATVFSRWEITLPHKRVMVTREMMGLGDAD